MELSKGFDQIRLVFDRYCEQSLKSRTRSKRTAGYQVRYKITDTTDISNVSLKQFLSHIETKQELTIYLAKLARFAFESEEITFTITYDRQCESNIPNYRIPNHDHEEADTLLILQAVDIASTNPFMGCCIYSPDTDVFLLAIHYYHMLPMVSKNVVRHRICLYGYVGNSCVFSTYFLKLK